MRHEIYLVYVTVIIQVTQMLQDTCVQRKLIMARYAVV